MTREEAFKVLEPFIPSLKREYIRWGEKRDKSVDKSWLFRDDVYRRPNRSWSDLDKEEFLPEIIPEHFLEGLEASIVGEGTYVVQPNTGEEKGRRVYLEILDFAYYGNTHKYGKLLVNGVRWENEKRGCWTSSNKLCEVEPRVSSIWEVELSRIIGKGEMAESEGSEGEATGRFTFLDELIATAAYVTLLRIQGPISMDNASSYATVRTPKDMLLTVDSNDNVEFGEKLKRILKLN